MDFSNLILRMASYYSIIFATVFLSMVASSHQIKCYSCYEGEATKITKLKSLPFYQTHSVKAGLPPACGDFADSVLIECPAGFNVCWKVDGSLGDETASIHDCGTTADACKDVEDAGDLSGLDDIDCYSCSEDQCNSATGLAATFSFLLLAAILTKLH